MKFNHLASTVIVASLALWAAAVKAAPVTNQFERLNFTLVGEEQALDDVQTSPGVHTSTLRTLKIANKDILNLLAAAFKTNWPGGSQLALDNVNGDIFVVDKSGANPVLDLSIGLNVGGTNVTYFSFSANPPVISGKTVINNTSQHVSQTQYRKIFFHVFNEQNGVTNTDLAFDGLDKAELNEQIKTTDTINWKDDAEINGDGTFVGTLLVFKGQVTGSGKWNGLPPG